MSLPTNNMPCAIALELADWQRYQLDFTRHLRDPKCHRKPRGVNQQRLRIYSDTLYDNVAAVVTLCFPVLSSLLGKRRWQRLMRGFFAMHRCHSPYFRQIPAEFLQYLQHDWQADAAYPDFMLELAHYEWIELSLSISNRDQMKYDYLPDGNLLDGIPVINPVMVNLAYRYPVHRISPTFKPTHPPQATTHLLVYRDADDEIRFSLQNPVTAHLIDLIIPAEITGRQALTQLAIALQHPQPDTLISFGHALLKDLRTSGCVMGTRVLAQDRHPPADQ